MVAGAAYEKGGALPDATDWHCAKGGRWNAGRSGAKRRVAKMVTVLYGRCAGAKLATFLLQSRFDTTPIYQIHGEVSTSGDDSPEARCCLNLWHVTEESDNN